MNELKEVNSIFEQPWWLDIVAQGKWHELTVRNKNNEVIGRLPYADINKYGLSYCGIPVLTQTLGPWIKLDKGMKQVAKLKRIKQVSEELIKQLKTKRNIDLYFHQGFQYVLPFIWAGYRVEPQFSYIIDDFRDLDIVLTNMDAKIRNLIKGARKNVEIISNISVDEMIYLEKASFEKQGRKFPWDEDIIRKIYNLSQQYGHGKALAAIDKVSKKAIAVAFLVYDEHTCYYLLGGKDYASKIQGTQELLLWEGIKFAATVSREFDFEGSMIPGIESFFRGFGGKPYVYYRIRKGSLIADVLEWIKPKVKMLLGYK